MKNTATHNDNVTYDPLTEARALALPSRESMLQRAPSVKRFWDTNTHLLTEAWRAWETSEESPNFEPDTSLLDPKLREAVEQAWLDPTKEVAVQDLWEEVSAGVYQAQFFDPERLADLREYLEAVADAGIPTRPPYGIALNRHGAMLDPRSEGYLAAPAFQAFYRQVMDQYMRPIARLLFPDVMGYDSQTFGFSIQYQVGIDTSLQPHTDASAATLNINMNLPDESFAGSEVDFYDRVSGEVKRITFKPGTAMLHRGNIPHAAHPITSGTRSNMVLWLYGDRMQIPVAGQHIEQVDAKLRWTIPADEADKFAPF
ncbi:2OG-Fe(II) oxygenase [Enterovibrio sp. ZSDZ42]|uniref:2OG-Fe(II) oxygenase n=1 Tax=Enterovibrio gelatinilyticus TaxID=2899819 RepID=A0ABT5QUV0_9GAMM|nr:2OG-Fe(II) oxygenase [Enterovibrio sp. ZSDZ42]MDD1791783.1 2OG-Fe(II) oxygenase [Enterovibrio sp. ZSDZ42]